MDINNEECFRKLVNVVDRKCCVDPAPLWGVLSLLAHLMGDILRDGHAKTVKTVQHVIMKSSVAAAVSLLRFKRKR